MGREVAIKLVPRFDGNFDAKVITREVRTGQRHGEQRPAPVQLHRRAIATNAAFPVKGI